MKNVVKDFVVCICKHKNARSHLAHFCRLLLRWSGRCFNLWRWHIDDTY